MHFRYQRTLSKALLTGGHALAAGVFGTPDTSVVVCRALFLFNKPTTATCSSIAQYALCCLNETLRSHTPDTADRYTLLEHTRIHDARAPLGHFRRALVHTLALSRSLPLSHSLTYSQQQCRNFKVFCSLFG
uniref:Putative secreted protein n=1 Tax=Anopheles marajoara TaxID=58244 RepID=A0A2M4C6W2_9DIPT